MATVIGTGLNVAGLRSEFFRAFDATQTLWRDLATTIASNKDRESYRWLGALPAMREWGTGRLVRGLRVESYDVANEKYEATLEVDRVEIEDDLTGQIRIRVRELAQLAATHKDFLISGLLANSGSTGFESYDGLPFFSDSHVSGSSGTQDNDLTTTVVSTTDVTTDEFKKSIKSAITAILGFKDDQGNPMSLGAAGLVAVVPPALYVTALEALSATVISQTTNVLAGAARVALFPWLTDGAVWYLLKTDTAVRPFIFQDRVPVEFTALEGMSDEGFRRDKFLYGVRARYRMTYGEWRHCVRVTFVVA